MNTQPAVEVQIIGTWEVEVTIRNCDTGAGLETLRATDTFAPAGGLIETGARIAPYPNSPGQGNWLHVAGLSYAAVLNFYRFNPDGSVSQLQKVSRRLELSDDGNRFSGTGMVEVFDANGSLILSRCSTETAKRFE